MPFANSSGHPSTLSMKQPFKVPTPSFVHNITPVAADRSFVIQIYISLIRISSNCTRIVSGETETFLSNVR